MKALTLVFLGLVVCGLEKDVFATEPLADISSASKSAYSLSVYPNPVNTHVYFNIKLDQSSEVSIAIFNTLGQKQLSMNSNLGMGSRFMIVNLDKLPAGVYSYHINISADKAQHHSGKIVKMK